MDEYDPKRYITQRQLFELTARLKLNDANTVEKALAEVNIYVEHRQER